MCVWDVRETKNVHPSLSSFPYKNFPRSKLHHTIVFSLIFPFTCIKNIFPLFEKIKINVRSPHHHHTQLERILHLSIRNTRTHIHTFEITFAHTHTFQYTTNIRVHVTWKFCTESVGIWTLVWSGHARTWCKFFGIMNFCFVLKM